MRLLLAGCFLYTLVVGLAIQRVVLPYVVPHLHGGHGLLIESDYLYFHDIAVRVSADIGRQGWAAWEPFPEGQPVAGVAAFFYALVAPEPWTVLPLNAALHTAAVLVLYLVFRAVMEPGSQVWAAVLPFLALPTSLTWTAQYHNDSYLALGTLLYLYAFVSLVDRRTGSETAAWASVGLSALAGLLLVWFVRPFLLEVYLAFGVACLAAWGGGLMYGTRSGGRLVWRTLPGVAMLVVILGVVPLSRSSARQPQNLDTTLDVLRSEGASECEAMENWLSGGERFVWRDTAWLPAVVDDRLRAVALERDGNLVRWACAASTVDASVRLGSASDLVRYLPRALVVGTLAPFPRMWVERGPRASSGAMRTAAAVEMAAVYAGLLALPYALWRWRRFLPLWVLLAFCGSLIALLSLVTPNVGTLVRLRYVYLMPVVGLGFASWVVVVGDIVHRRSR